MSYVHVKSRTIEHALVAIALLASACSPPFVSGTLTSVQGALGSWSFTPTHCRSGSAREFYGVDLSDGTRNIRLIDDSAKGYVVTVAATDDPAVPTELLTPLSCGRFAASLSGSTDEQSTGSLDLDCSTPEGGHLQGNVTFENCGSDF